MRGLTKKLLSIAVFFLITSCNKHDSFEQKKREYQAECTGDLTVRCRSKLIDLNIAKLEAAIEAVKGKKDEIVACKGQQFYDGGIGVIRDRIEYFKDLKPNLFARIVFSRADVELNLPTYRREAEFQAFLVAADPCTRGMAASPPMNVHIAGQFNSNANNLPVVLQTVAGKLERAQLTNGQFAVTLNGNPLFKGDDSNWQFPLRSFFLSSGRQAILMASSGGRGNSCETMLFFLIADNAGIKATPEFGTCSAAGSFKQDGDHIIITVPKMGGNSIYKFDGSTVTEDGNEVSLRDDNNPAN